MWLKTLVIGFAWIFLAHGIKENKIRYGRMYNVRFKTDEQVKLFHDIESHLDGLIFMGHARSINENLTILAAAQKTLDFTYILTSNNIAYTVLDNNFQAKIDEEEKSVKSINTTASEFDWRHYFHLETIYVWMDHLCAKYPDTVQKIDVGNSYEGRPIRGVKLSKKKNNTAIVIEGGTHAREWISPATATFILDKLLTSNDKDVQDIAENFDWIFFPVINPDGYKFSMEKDRMWRKTRQPFGLCIGTDLNRNWDSAWNTTESSSNPCDSEYAGNRVWSEREADLLSKYLLSIAKPQMIQTYISLHSYSQLLLFPYGYTSEKVSSYDDLKAIGERTIEAIAKRYGTIYKTGSVYETLYPLSGSSLDWAYSKLNTPISFAFELRETSNSTNLFILPAAQIEPTGWETIDGLIALLKEARARGYYNVKKIASSQKSASKNVGNGMSIISIIMALVFTTVCLMLSVSFTS